MKANRHPHVCPEAIAFAKCGFSKPRRGKSIMGPHWLALPPAKWQVIGSPAVIEFAKRAVSKPCRGKPFLGLQHVVQPSEHGFRHGLW